MGFKKFSLLIIVRTSLLIVSIFALVYLVQLSGYAATVAILAFAILVQLYALFRFVTKTNAELSRFLAAAKYEDFGQRFDLQSLGAGFGELGETFTDILKRIGDKRTDQAENMNWLKAIIEHVPTPLISVAQQGQVTLWNNSARRLFGTNKVTCEEDLKHYGKDFHRFITETPNGERRLVKFRVDGQEHQLTLSVNNIIHGEQTERLVCLQDIGSELDSTQFQAWQDLVRVLTHEIMNSITPIASLANTAATLLNETRHTSENVSDATDAVTTMARRSQGLIEFVNSYRRLTRLPQPQKKPINLLKLLQRVEMLFRESSSKHVSIKIAIEPDNLEVNVDATMLEQLFINLLQNAEQAIPDNAAGKITITAGINRRSQLCIMMKDNGCGIPDNIRDNIFVPFFTTKKQGSGVGLALSRQIMLVHGGSIRLDNVEQGTQFTLLFP